MPILTPIFAALDFTDHVESAYLASAWIAALVALSLQTSFLTPPFGYALFFAKTAAPAEVSLADVYRGAIPLVVLELLLLVLVSTFPALMTWLPENLLDLTGILPVLLGG